MDGSAHLTEDQRLIQETAQRFARDRLAPFAAEWDRDKRTADAPLKEMGPLGLMGMLVPPEWDGAGIGYAGYGLAIEEIAAGDGGVTTAAIAHNSLVCTAILSAGSDEQRERFLKPLARGEMLGCYALTEAQAGSDAANQRTRAVRDGDHYVINGSKNFISSGSRADIAIVVTTTDPKAGSRGITTFIVPTDLPGYSVGRVEAKLGQHSCDACHLIFEDLRVPASFRLGDEGEGYKITLSNLEGSRIGIAAQSVGLARAAFEAALAYARERETFGKKIVDHQAVGFRVANMATEIEAARRLYLHAGNLRDAGRPALKEASMAKLFAAEMTERVCSEALQTLGGYGYLADYPIERIYRDARVCRIYEGTSDVQRMLIARSLEKGE